MQNSKACTKCGQIKPLYQFSKHNGKKASKSGLRARCKSCEIEAANIYRAKNPEKVRATKRKYALANPDKKAVDDKKYRLANQEKIAQQNKDWRQRNADYCKQKSLEWRTKNKELKAAADRKYAANNKSKINENSKRWRANNPERAREVSKNSRLKNPETGRNTTARRRARVAENGVYRVTSLELVSILRKPCAYCGAKSEHVDHIIPITRGGHHAIGNLTGACAPCNLSKGSKFIMEWRKGRK